MNGVGFMVSEGENFTSGPKTASVTQLHVAKVLLKWKGTEKVSDIDTRRGQRVPPSPVLSRPYILFQLVINNRKVLPDPLPQHTFEDNRISQKIL